MTTNWLSTLLRALVACAAALGMSAGAASLPAQVVDLPGDGALHAYWFPGEGVQPRPAIVALHGCGGLQVRSSQRLAARYREAAARLNAQGYAVLMPDSFGSRGVQRVCQTRYRERTVGIAQRVRDAEAALAWLSRQPGVDVTRMAVLGWSNGATTALNVLAQRHQQPVAGTPALAAVAVFYPGCEPLRRRHADLGRVPLLLQIGALDDWTPAAPCEALVQQLRERSGSDVELHVYADSYHGFDSRAPVRLRGDVPRSNTVIPLGQEGVHQGGNPQARAASLASLDAFFTRTLKPGRMP